MWRIKLSVIIAFGFCAALVVPPALLYACYHAISWSFSNMCGQGLISGIAMIVWAYSVIAVFPLIIASLPAFFVAAMFGGC